MAEPTALTYINQKIKTRADLKKWIMRKLGFPMVTVELNEDQLDDAINDATLIWTKWAQLPMRYIALNLEEYPVADELNDTPEGFDLSPFRVAAVYSIATGDQFSMTGGDTLWSVGNAMLATGSYPFFNSGVSRAGGWTTFQAVSEFVKLSRRIMCSEFDFLYDNITQRLQLIPNPVLAGRAAGWTCIQAEVVPPDSQLYGNEYVKRFALAYAKITLGNVRKKFTNVTLPGGGHVDQTIGDEGRAELEKLVDSVKKDEAMPGGWFIG